MGDATSSMDLPPGRSKLRKAVRLICNKYDIIMKCYFEVLEMATKNRQEYEKDFYAWAIHNAKLLREGRLSEVDIEHIAKEGS